MKYLKLYENFNPTPEEDISDILWILREIDNDSKLILNELNGNLLLFNVERPKSFKASDLLEPLERFENMGYKMVQYNGETMLIVNQDYFENTSLNAVILKFLNDKYGNLKQTKGHKDTFQGKTYDDFTNYVDENNKLIFSINNKNIGGNPSQICYIDEDIFEYLYKLYSLKFDKVKSIITEWLNQSYGLEITNLRSTLDLNRI